MRKPRAHVLLAFEDEARQATLRVGQRRGVAVLDAAGLMNGQDKLFADDLLHFNDQGAATLATALASQVTTSIPSRSPAHAAATTASQP